jgi:hypothetical protein
MSETTDTASPNISPEMALALYASTAATLAVRQFVAAGTLGGEEVDSLVGNLAACRNLAPVPALEEHVELLLDLLLSAKAAGDTN